MTRQTNGQQDHQNLKSHFEKWEKDWRINATERLEGNYTTNHVETITPPPSSFARELLEMRTQIQATQLALSTQQQASDTVTDMMFLTSTQLTEATGRDTASNVSTE